MFGGWLLRSGYEPDNRPALEIYRTPLLSGTRDERVTDLMVPLMDSFTEE